MALTSQDYKNALLVQSACNLAGVVNILAKIMFNICIEAREKGEGTDYINHHPICRLYAEQISHLSGGGMTSNSDSYSKAYIACEERAGKDDLII